MTHFPEKGFVWPSGGAPPVRTEQLGVRYSRRLAITTAHCSLCETRKNCVAALGSSDLLAEFWIGQREYLVGEFGGELSDSMHFGLDRIREKPLHLGFLVHMTQGLKDPADRAGPAKVHRDPSFCDSRAAVTWGRCAKRASRQSRRGFCPVAESKVTPVAIRYTCRVETHVTQ